MSEKRPTIEEIDAETEELLQQTLALREKVKSDIRRALELFYRTQCT